MRRATITRKPYGYLLTSWDGLTLHHAWRITGPLALNTAFADAQKWVRPRDRCRLTMELRAAHRLRQRTHETVHNVTQWLRRFARAEKVWWGRHRAVTRYLAELLRQPTETP